MLAIVGLIRPSANKREQLRTTKWRARPDCNDEQRLDVHNGLLLSALWDSAFDCGPVSFADDGTVLASPQLSQRARAVLDVGNAVSKSD